MDSFLGRATPLVLLALAVLAWFGKLLPGHDALVRSFGDDAVLRFVTGLLCVYMVMLVIERHRLERNFKQVLGAFREFHGKSPDAEPSRAEAAQREAVEILIAALESDDAEVRKTSVTHLERLTGQKLGADPAAWRSWLERQQRTPAKK